MRIEIRTVDGREVFQGGPLELERDPPDKLRITLEVTDQQRAALAESVGSPVEVQLHPPGLPSATRFRCHILGFRSSGKGLPIEITILIGGPVGE